MCKHGKSFSSFIPMPAKKHAINNPSYKKITTVKNNNQKYYYFLLLTMVV